jgi:hypothetical protein
MPSSNEKKIAFRFEDFPRSLFSYILCYALVRRIEDYFSLFGLKKKQVLVGEVKDESAFEYDVVCDLRKQTSPITWIIAEELENVSKNFGVHFEFGEIDFGVVRNAKELREHLSRSGLSYSGYKVEFDCESASELFSEGFGAYDKLKTVDFGKNFDKSLVGVELPPFLETLHFRYPYNHSLVGVNLPSSLQTLILCYPYNHSLIGVNLPFSLQSLYFNSAPSQRLIGVNLPSYLQILEFGDDYN